MRRIYPKGLQVVSASQQLLNTHLILTPSVFYWVCSEFTIYLWFELQKKMKTKPSPTGPITLLLWWYFNVFSYSV